MVLVKEQHGQKQKVLSGMLLCLEQLVERVLHRKWEFLHASSLPYTAPSSTHLAAPLPPGLRYGEAYMMTAPSSTAQILQMPRERKRHREVLHQLHRADARTARTCPARSQRAYHTKAAAVNYGCNTPTSQYWQASTRVHCRRPDRSGSC